MIEEDVRYSFEGHTFRGALIRNNQAQRPAPGVLVCPDAWGLTPFAAEKTRDVARLGYVALTADLYGDGGKAASYEEAHQFSQRLMADLPSMLRVAKAGMDLLSHRPEVDRARLAIIGYCLGGATALNLARRGFHCAAAVSFHGSLQTTAPAAPGEVKARILVCTGARDPLVPMTQVASFQEEMIAAQADCEIIIYAKAGHSFAKQNATPRAGFGYDEMADKRSRSAMKTLLEEVFGS